MTRAGRLGLACVLLAAAGCGAGDGETALDVFAAASLTEPFTRLAADFEAAHPGVDVRLQFAGSAELAAQIVHGAPADVFAAADEATMDLVVGAGRDAGAPVVFARNRLAIAVRPGNPLGIGGLADLGDRGRAVVLCAAQVPCGRYARAALEIAGVDVTPLTRTDSVTAAVTLVELGEADAAVVYATDVRARPGVDGVAIDADHQVPVALPIVALRDGGNGEGGNREGGNGDLERARRWVDFVASPAARRVLVDDFGFLAP